MIYPYKLRTAYGCDELLIENHPTPNHAEFIEILTITMADLTPCIESTLIDNMITYYEGQFYSLSTNQGKAELSIDVTDMGFIYGKNNQQLILVIDKLLCASENFLKETVGFSDYK